MYNKSCDLEDLELLQTNQDINLQAIDFPGGKHDLSINISVQYKTLKWDPINGKK